MFGTTASDAGWRPYRRPACLLAVGLVATLGGAYALATTALTSSTPARPATGALSIHVAPASRTVVPGESTRYTLRVTRPHRGRIGLGGRTSIWMAPGLPSGAFASFAPRRGLPSQQASHRATALTIATDVGTPAGTYVLRVRAHRPHRNGVATIRLTVAAHGGLAIAGDLPGQLAPGSGRPLDLSLTNRESRPLAVSDLGVEVAAVSAPRADPAHPCATGDFSVTQFSGPSSFTLPASSTISLGQLGFPAAQWPRISMLNLATNQDGCKRASLTLSYTASASEGAP